MDKEEYIKLWIEKADGDLKVAKRELHCEDPVLDAVCFHLQQAVEKYLKAFLAKFLEKIEKTHNLEFLIEQCIQIDKDFNEYEEKFDQIAECGVEIRYPDTFLMFEDDELMDMLEIVAEFRTFVLGKINIDGNEVPTSAPKQVNDEPNHSDSPEETGTEF
jgi:HEPN domain-containing protein